MPSDQAPFAAAILALILAPIGCGDPEPAASSASSANGTASATAGAGASGTSSSSSSTSGTGGAAGAANATFRGPLNQGPDPFMTYREGFYYLSTTQGDALRLWKAPTVGDLRAAEPVTIWQDGDPSQNQQIWAPALYFLNGHWYVYYTSDDGIDEHHRLRVIESDGADALGPYHFKATLAVPGSDEWAIDGELLEIGGALYMLWSGAGAEGHNLIYIAPMSDPWTISGPRTYLPAAGGCPEVREGPAVLQHDGATFVVYSTCDTGKPDYQLWMLRLIDGADPLKAESYVQTPSPVLLRNDPAGVLGPGHNGFFKSPDGTEDWIVYHAKNTAEYTYEGRTTRIDPVVWKADGTPDFGLPPQVSATRTVPAGDPGGGPFWIDDDGTSEGPGSLSFSGTWTAYPQCGAACFYGNDHGTTEAGATATFTFTGTQIALISARDAGNGQGAASMDGGPETIVEFYMPIRQGEQIVYLSPHVASGEHVLRLRATGTKSPSSAGTAISVDRAEVSTR